MINREVQFWSLPRKVLKQDQLLVKGKNILLSSFDAADFLGGSGEGSESSWMRRTDWSVDGWEQRNFPRKNRYGKARWCEGSSPSRKVWPRVEDFPLSSLLCSRHGWHQNQISGFLSQDWRCSLKKKSVIFSQLRNDFFRFFHQNCIAILSKQRRTESILLGLFICGDRCGKWRSHCSSTIQAVAMKDYAQSGFHDLITINCDYTLSAMWKDLASYRYCWT